MSKDKVVVSADELADKYKGTEGSANTLAINYIEARDALIEFSKLA